MKRTLNGWHVLALFGLCFGVIIAVNLTLAFQAVATFPGIVTKNSYVASQRFDADKAAQDALGWTVHAGIEGGILTLAITDAGNAAVHPPRVSAVLGRATHVNDDVVPAFEWTGTHLVAPVDVAPGYWTLWLDMTAEDGTPFRRRLPLTVAEAQK